MTPQAGARTLVKAKTFQAYRQIHRADQTPPRRLWQSGDGRLQAGIKESRMKMVVAGFGRQCPRQPNPRQGFSVASPDVLNAAKCRPIFTPGWTELTIETRFRNRFFADSLNCPDE